MWVVVGLFGVFLVVWFWDFCFCLLASSTHLKHLSMQCTAKINTVEMQCHGI